MRLRSIGALTVAALALVATASAQEAGGQYNIANFTPAYGPPGTTINIVGSGVGTSTGVTFNGKPAQFTVGAAYQVYAVVPQGATSGPIVISRNGQTAKSTSDFIVGTAGGPPPASIVDPPPHISPPAGALTGHPRLWVRGSDINRLRGWAVPGNQVWNDLKTVANNMKADMLQGKVPQQDSGDGEGNAFAYPTEEYAEIFAFMSLVDPVAANRADWAKRAHDLMMVVINNAVQGPAANQPFRTPHFITMNRGRWYGESFPLVLDWCYPLFSAAEKATIRKVFIRWIHESLDVNQMGGSYVVQPSGMVNSPGMLSNKGSVRWSGNNYWCNHARNIGMMSLALDPADDVPAAAGDPKAGYVGDYIGNVTGAWLYVRSYADTHDLAGGLSQEGPGYGESSFSALTMLMLAMHTAGYDDPAVYGSPAAIAQNPFWKSDAMTAYIHSMSPQKATFASWMPPMYLPAGYGDVLRFETIDMIRAFGPLAIMDLADGNTTSTRLNSIRWMQTWLSPGGPTSLDKRLVSSPSNYGSMLPILYFLTFDPTAPAPLDPRVGLSTDYVAPGMNRILSRTDWTANASWFAFISTWNVTDHQWGNANSFSFYRGGEFLTKEWSGYGKNIGASDYQNNLSIQNPPTGAGIPWFNVDEGTHGGQYSYSSNGDPVVKSSLQGSYVFAEGDSTNRYNTTIFHATDVAHASRSILYLKPDTIVVYDRATSKSANRYKRFYLNFATQPVINGNTATVTTPKGQKLFVSSLLPAGASLTGDMPTTTWSYNEGTQDEPMHYRLCEQDPSNPLDVRFLNVLQGANSNAAPIQASWFAPSVGAFDGALFNNTAVLFAVNLNQAFTGLTYTVPVGTTSHFVTGLTPGAGYTVTQQTGLNGVTVTVTAGGTTIADSGGLIHF
ncbi:hypothetical protein [Fimbriimonas ginsengisoli]|uniref:IPT/TIG domain-containing protein n=1 Tax=Fimbriimonas ginsengisoli Gsoil 348 TaxID=661478 RepID=A0A068NQ09_FIMGI|nr:hypothetical protein [Fimbriimonas ginsengisoli]AIE85457.1 hypothetical protein OP10G_2089 [Fimbriimonas ginsengisoli Gsoil 348]